MESNHPHPVYNREGSRLFGQISEMHAHQAFVQLGCNFLLADYLFVHYSPFDFAVVLDEAALPVLLLVFLPVLLPLLMLHSTVGDPFDLYFLLVMKCSLCAPVA